MAISASARQRLTTGLWGGRKAGSFDGRAEVVTEVISTTVGGVRRGFLRRSYKAPVLPWERIPDEPVVIAKPARKRIRMPAIEAIRKATGGDIPIETMREIAAPVIHVPEIGTAVLADIDDDEDLIWLI